ncbi:hypothetical protein ACFVYT_41650 [Streptomyces sp. NPDC058290]|uniref:hypothetical protein n=1 Tax=Streptomyces sp. NPDC058290 TaxID=3346426 RepID=UPI0036E60DA6
MAVFAACVLCLGVHRCLGMRRPTAVAAGLSVVFLLVMTGMGAVGAVPWSARQMMVMYSFTWVGFTIGAIPSGRFLREHLRSGGQQLAPQDGGRVLPVRHVVFMCSAVSAMLLLAYVLVT